MTAKNDVTGDDIKSKISNNNFRDNFDKIFKTEFIKCKKWIGLTDKEYELMAEKYVTNYFFDTLKYAHAIEQTLKEKNK